MFLSQLTPAHSTILAAHFKNKIYVTVRKVL